MLLSKVADLEARAPNDSRIVVIGSGAVGLYTASELAKSGRSVVVVESGGVLPDSFDPDSYTSVGRKHEGISDGRSKSLGGTSNLWSGQLSEFQPIDFEGREWMPGSKWPVSYDEIARYYRQTYENLEIVGDAQNDDRVWSHLPNVKPLLGQGLETFLTRWLPIPSFAAYKADQIETSANLVVLTSHTVVGFRGSHGLITGVRVVDRTATGHTIQGDTFIVAAGTIETVRLLLHSATATDWECPWRDNALVGSRFQDHLGGRVAFVHPKDQRLFFKTFCNIVWSGRKYQPKIRLKNETLEHVRILNMHGMFTFESPITENLWFVKNFVKRAIQRRDITGVYDFLTNLRACSKYLIPMTWTYARHHRVFEPRSSAIWFAIQGEQIPLPESSIRIDRSTVDANGLPRVVLDWRVSAEELESIREFTLRTDRALRAAEFAHLDIHEDLLRSDPRFLSKMRDTNHQAGGVIMGTSEKDGVVDRDLKVFGTKNLYVAGASTFRTIGGANITFTALAFATRLVEHLTSQHAQR